MLRQLALHLSAVCQRYVPSALTLAALLTLIVMVLGVTLGRVSAIRVVQAWGDGFWLLLRFGMQMCLIVFLGYIVAVSRPVERLLRGLACAASGPRRAIAVMALSSITLCWLHWGLGLVGSAVMVRFVAQRQPSVDYRLLVASSYFGMGVSWHAGLSGSAPLLLASPGNFLIKAGVVRQVIGVERTLLMPFNLAFTATAALMVTLIAVWMHPPAEQRVHAQLSGSPQPGDQSRGPARTFAERLTHSRAAILLLALCAAVWLAQHLAVLGVAAAVDLNLINLVFFALAFGLHRSIHDLEQAARDASGHLHGIVLQFPLYAGMFGVIKGTQLASRIAAAFVRLSSERTLPLMTFWYSAALNYFVPSGGSKWAIEAPYLIKAGDQLGVCAERVAMAYAYGDMSTNLIQPFWAIPLLSVAKLSFSDIMGFELVVFLSYAAAASLGLLCFY